MQNNKDFPETGMCILCFLFPIIGIIYYIVKHNDEPNSCNTYLKWCITSIIIYAIGYGILTACSIALITLP